MQLCGDSDEVERWLDRARRIGIASRFTLDPPEPVLESLIRRLSDGLVRLTAGYSGAGGYALGLLCTPTSTSKTPLFQPSGT